ncbi:hypothetical protein HII36_37570 [Nonomuraea sp. NN258]|uniref:hypothetical protein n=1 Tax=Nonomuraea antri TaxID=2730852 RepID=UPI001568A729|nr:hypothetical protein [Nonomuraea antri]NRQ37501.1 hypothetical protein [Nonomuraea antri]
MTRMVVIDDDPYVRRGVAAFLGECAGIQVLAVLDHEAALLFGRRWREIDLALVDAADDSRTDDQFPGVAVVEEIRRQCGADHRPRVMVVTGHAYDEAVRRRMREAGADYLYDRRSLMDEQAMLSAVLRPSSVLAAPAGRTPEEERLGISRHTRVNAAVAYALAENIPSRLARRENPRGRVWDRIREEFNQIARLATVNSDGLPPDRAQDEPSRRQLNRFLTWATKVKRPS